MTIGSLDIFPRSTDINSLTGYPLTTAHGGTGTTFLGNGVLVGNGYAPISSIPLSSGQVLIGSTGMNPVPSTLTAGPNVIITNSPGQIIISAVTGSTGVYDANTGSATPLAGVLNIIGAGPLSTTASSNTISINLTGIVGPGTGGSGVSNPPAHTLPVAEGSAAWNFLGPLLNGQLLIGQTNADPIPAYLTAGTGITISNTTGAITISSSALGADWIDQTTSTTIAPNTGYVADSASLVVLTVPVTPAFGEVFRVAGKGSGGWQIALNPGQTIAYGDLTTSSGGSLSSSNSNDTVEILCTSSSTFTVLSSIGNLTTA